jgi:hypothetical protein
MRRLASQMLLSAVLLSGERGAARAEPAPVAFDSFVEVHAPPGEPLRGWGATREVLRATLRAWFPGLAAGTGVEDGSPRQLARFLGDLPRPGKAAVSVVYLASRQAPEGAFVFPSGERRPWGELLDGANFPTHGGRIVILDACYATRARHAEGWARFAPTALFASGDREVTSELDLSTKRPVDLRGGHPEAWRWTREHLPSDWDGKLSFLGWIWLEAFLATPSAPSSPRDWGAFFADCQRRADEFRERVDRRSASRLSFVAPAPASP